MSFEEMARTGLENARIGIGGAIRAGLCPASEGDEAESRAAASVATLLTSPRWRRAGFASWSRKAGYYAAVDAARSSARFPALHEHFDRLAGPAGPGWSDWSPGLRRSVNRLARAQREVICRSFGIDRPAEDDASIGEVLGLTAQGVGHLRRSALARLRDSLGRAAACSS